MNFLLGVGGGFLLAVLWMDLMFDVLVFSRGIHARRGGEFPEEVLGEIASYYRRVTTTASPMNYLVAAVMAAMVLTLVTSLVSTGGNAVLDVASLVLCGVPIALALARIFPAAARLGARKDSPVEQSRLAHEICRAHIACFLAMTAFVAIRWKAGV